MTHGTASGCSSMIWSMREHCPAAYSGPPERRGLAPQSVVVAAEPPLGVLPCGARDTGGGDAATSLVSSCSPSRQGVQPLLAPAVRTLVRSVFPRHCGQLATKLALRSRPLRRRGLVHRLHHTVALEHACHAWHACSMAPGTPRDGERSAPFLP